MGRGRGGSRARRGPREASARESPPRRQPRRAAAAALLAAALGCASIEPGRHGLRRLDIEGQRAVSERAITECLISRERGRFELRVGLGQPRCGEPPFDADPPRLRLWRWPWTEWPSFNRAVFDRDLERVLRFYRARGFHDARVVRVDFRPEDAGRGAAGSRCEADDCQLDIVIVVEEGEPTRVARTSIQGTEGLPAPLVAALEGAVRLRPGEPVDEALHDESKRGLERLLYAGGWAAARVTGSVVIDRASRSAEASYALMTGERHVFGAVVVRGHGALPREVIEKAADVEPGRLFDPEVLREIQAEVFALGAFSSVEVEERLDAERARADVVITVTPLPPDALRVGAGVLSGAVRRTETGELQSIPQWDVHLFGRYQRRHLFGSLAQLSVEDRPRLIFNAAFPAPESPRPGNVASVALTQPGWLEPRTTAFARAVWDYGPDPFLGFYRSDLFFRLGLTRGFWRRRLLGTLAAQQDVFSVFDQAGSGAPSAAIPSSHRYAHLEQDLRLDLRDSAGRPRRGAYLGLSASEALRWAASDWTALRVSPELRVYLPLPLDIVLASRAALARLWVLEADPELDPLSRELGPSNYRLRGGGASSNRGFAAGTLGAGRGGGTRRWEASLELRVPIGEALVLAAFADAGDVTRGGRYRFDHLNVALGYGLRYHTVIGALRLDVGHRVRDWQRLGGGDLEPPDAGELPFSGAPGAVHLTIGEPF